MYRQGYIQPHGPYNDPYAAPPSRQAAEPVVLDDYNSDLNFLIEPDGVTGGSRHEQGFEYMWAGARATHGVQSGKAAFEVQVLNKLPVSMPETERTPHVMRVGWSTDLSSFQVGEDAFSYGYGGTGKCSVNNKFFDYGEPYTCNDIITCYVDLDATPKAIFFAKNGRFLNVAFRLGPELDGQTLYPHITVKNMRFTVNFGKNPPYFPVTQGFSLLEWLHPHSLVRGSVGPRTREECEVIMMVGLPGAGKTYWVDSYVRSHKEKQYNILGTNAIMDRMKVMGLMRKRNYHGRWDMLIKQATDLLNQVFKIAEKKNRNYILDQTNVYPNARRKKMNNFRGYRRISAVVVTTNEVLKQRTEKREREEGKIVPEAAVVEMKSNFTLPEVGQMFNDVWFLEEDKNSSERLVREFRQEAQAFKDAERKRKTGENQAFTHSTNSTPDLKKPRAAGPAAQMCSAEPPQHRYSQHDTHNTVSYSARPLPGVSGTHGTGGGCGNYAPHRRPQPVQHNYLPPYGQPQTHVPSEHDDACTHAGQPPYGYDRSQQGRYGDHGSSSSYAAQPDAVAQNLYYPPIAGPVSGWSDGSAAQGYNYGMPESGYQNQSYSGHQTRQSYATEGRGYQRQSYNSHQTAPCGNYSQNYHAPYGPRGGGYRH